MPSRLEGGYRGPPLFLLFVLFPFHLQISIPEEPQKDHGDEKKNTGEQYSENRVAYKEGCTRQDYEEDREIITIEFLHSVEEFTHFLFCPFTKKNPRRDRGMKKRM
jgi:hypothetical protein